MAAKTVNLLEQKIKTDKRQLEKLIRLEGHSRKVWTKAYQLFLRAANQLTKIKVHGTKKEAGLIKKIRDWPAETVRLTKERDDLRAQIKQTEQALVKLGIEQAKLVEQQINEIKTIDEIVTQVFGLNAAVVRASGDREDCLTRHVFPRLIDAKGNLRSQISFTSSDGLRRVVAMVNTMTIVRGDLAAQAKSEIQCFFDRFQRVAKMDDTVKPLFDLTRQLLVEKTDFKVGPDLYRFLSMELDADIFPELSKAQTLLRQSIRSEKTSSYIRIYERDNRASPWRPVAQS
ncbi:hypothetical protein FP830_04265 [Candidatus Falkowbacteria bacterium]|nr:hypothetical protein [Candidatus Falkowbacteria bacterium]